MNTFFTYTELTDSGPYLTKLILNLPETVADGAARPETFSVFVRRLDRQTGEVIKMRTKNFSPESIKDTRDGLSQGWRKITAVYPCDSEGRPASENNKLALSMSYGPLEPLSLCSAPKTQYHNAFVDMEIRVTQLAPIPGAASCMGLVFDQCSGDINPALKGWQFSNEVTKEHPLRYGWFQPDGTEGERHPLLIWLHGAGGGGEDPRYPVQGNRATAFSSVQSQKKLGKPWVFIPQCPTVWMDDGENTPLMTHNKTIYIEILKKAIDSFIMEHKDSIDMDRIYIAGASNGGFMAVMQTLNYPGFYAAAVPVCEAVITAQLTDDDIRLIARTPMWLVHVKNDFVVDPDRSTVPLYERLRAAGADVHFTYLDHVKDHTGHFKNADGTPYSYIPHFAWIPVYNDECRLDYDGSPVVVNGRAVTLQEWVGLQHR